MGALVVPPLAGWNVRGYSYGELTKTGYHPGADLNVGYGDADLGLPVVLVMLNCLGIVSARALRRSWRLIVVAITLFSALVTPAADVLSMFLVAVPMSALFGAALLITGLHDRRAARRTLDSDHPVVAMNERNGPRLQDVHEERIASRHRLNNLGV